LLYHNGISSDLAKLACNWFQLEIGGWLSGWLGWYFLCSLRNTHAQNVFPPEKHLLLPPESFEIDNGNSNIKSNNIKSNKLNLHT